MIEIRESDSGDYISLLFSDSDPEDLATFKAYVVEYALAKYSPAKWWWRRDPFLTVEKDYETGKTIRYCGARLTLSKERGEPVELRVFTEDELPSAMIQY